MHTSIGMLSWRELEHLQQPWTGAGHAERPEQGQLGTKEQTWPCSRRDSSRKRLKLEEIAPQKADETTAVKNDASVTRFFSFKDREKDLGSGATHDFTKYQCNEEGSKEFSALSASALQSQGQLGMQASRARTRRSAGSNVFSPGSTSSHLWLASV